MEKRDLIIKEHRGEQLGDILKPVVNEEVFQNTTLRPILKLQNKLLIAIVKNAIESMKIEFDNISNEKKKAVIDNLIKKEASLRNTLKGTIIGWFTIDEYQYYRQHSSVIDKRIMVMIIERINSQIENI